MRDCDDGMMGSFRKRKGPNEVDDRRFFLFLLNDFSISYLLMSGRRDAKEMCDIVTASCDGRLPASGSLPHPVDIS